jgi:UrcA family protein
MKSSIRIALGSFLVTAAALKAVPAFAEPIQPLNVSIVRTADLNLSTNAGRSALDRRLVIAAGEVCGAAADVDLAGKNQVRQCRANVLAKARARGEELASRGGDQAILVASSR